MEEDFPKEEREGLGSYVAVYTTGEDSTERMEMQYWPKLREAMIEYASTGKDQVFDYIDSSGAQSFVLLSTITGAKFSTRPTRWNERQDSRLMREETKADGEWND
jgi:hypothetical protein